MGTYIEIYLRKKRVEKNKPLVWNLLDIIRNFLGLPKGETGLKQVKQPPLYDNKNSGNSSKKKNSTSALKESVPTDKNKNNIPKKKTNSTEGSKKSTPRNKQGNNTAKMSTNSNKKILQKSVQINQKKSIPDKRKPDSLSLKRNYKIPTIFLSQINLKNDSMDNAHRKHYIKGKNSKEGKKDETKGIGMHKSIAPSKKPLPSFQKWITPKKSNELKPNLEPRTQIHDRIIPPIKSSPRFQRKARRLNKKNQCPALF